MEKKKYFIVSADALPEVFVKVAEAKRMLQVGEASTVGQAAAMVGIPTNGCAGVTVSAETSDMTEPMDEMISHLAAAEGVLRFEIMAG